MADAPTPIRCAGFTLTTRRPAPSTTIEHWAASGPDGLGEVYLGPPALLARAASLPVWGPFPDLRTGRINDGRAFVAIPGSLAFDLEELAARLAPGAAAAFAWHVGSALAEVHERGGAHGALHPAFVGLDARGKLSIRPAFAATLPAEPDASASAQATDCLQYGHLIEVLGLDRLDEPGLHLLRSGLTKDRARYRISPGRAARQAFAAVLARHTDWEAALVESLGVEWRLSNALRMPPKPVASPELAPVRLPVVGAAEPARVLTVPVPSGGPSARPWSAEAGAPARPAPAAAAAVPVVAPPPAVVAVAPPLPVTAPLPSPQPPTEAPSVPVHVAPRPTPAPRPESPSRVFARGDGLRLTVFPGPNASFEDDEEDDDLVPAIRPAPVALPLPAPPPTPAPAEAQAAPLPRTAHESDAPDDAPASAPTEVDAPAPEGPSPAPPPEAVTGAAGGDESPAAAPPAPRAPWTDAAAPPDPSAADLVNAFDPDEDDEDPPTRPDGLPALDAGEALPDAPSTGGEASLLAAVSAGLAQDDWAPEPSAPPPHVPRFEAEDDMQEDDPHPWDGSWDRAAPPPAAEAGPAPAVVDPIPLARAFPSLQMGRSTLAPSDDDAPDVDVAPPPLARSPLAAAAWAPEPSAWTPAPPPAPAGPAPRPEAPSGVGASEPPPWTPPVGLPEPLPPTTPEQPKWEGVRGVTGDARREDELGAGKWTESARSLAEVQGELAAGPPREIEPIEDSKGSKVFLIIGLCATAGLVLWWIVAG